METIIRVEKNHDADPFARIDKTPINDKSISYKSKGILVYVLSKPDGWHVNIKDLCNHATDQEKAVRSGLAELVAAKYSRRIRLIDVSTKRVIKWLYIFYERPYAGDLLPIETVEIENPHTQNRQVDIDPHAQKPQVEKPQVEKPQVENVPPINKVFKQLTNKITKDSINNNIGGQENDSNNVVVVIPENKEKEYLKLKARSIKLGWIGSDRDLKLYYLKDDGKYLTAWINKIEEIKKDVDNPAGLLRHYLRSGELPKEKKIQNQHDEIEALKKIGLTEDELKEIGIL